MKHRKILKQLVKAKVLPMEVNISNAENLSSTIKEQTIKFI